MKKGIQDSSKMLIIDCPDVRADMKEPLQWIKESLEEAMEDRDEESTEGIPLVPLSDESMIAMDLPNFQRLLRAIGIEPPADEQEAYWRVPASMLVSTIRKRCLLIEDALSGKFLAQGVLLDHQSILITFSFNT